MNRRREGSGAGDAILLVVLLVLGGVLGRLQNGAREKNRLDVVSSIVSGTVSPVASVAGGVSDTTGDFFYGVFAARKLVVENRRLRSRILAAQLYTEQTERMGREITSLRAIVKLPVQPGKNPIAVDVIGFFPRENRITLSAGSIQGIKPGMPVVVPDGLLAVIQTVEVTRSQALLITSPSQKVGALVLGHDPAPLGLAQGTAPDTISLPLSEPKAPVRVGDAVVTSGFGERIPPGIAIGRVIQVEDNAEFGTRRATVAPVANLGLAREAVILR
ncbi:rod shape-determining protein MreC [bacterium]|nr:MAG: rod shape-determining protein MreC [bacterium]